MFRNLKILTNNSWVIEGVIMENKTTDNKTTETKTNKKPHHESNLLNAG